METSYDINKIPLIPKVSGVYLMKDKEGNVIYIGKAINLRSRVRSYFSSSADNRFLTNVFVPQIADIEYILTDTEKEALLLENTLIKKHKPKYNINLKDDKTYVSLRINLNHSFPRVEVVRKRGYTPLTPLKRGIVGNAYMRSAVLYFGPYSSASSVRQMLKFIGDYFPLRRCSDNTFKTRTRPCVFYQIKKCSGPCCNLIAKEDYDRLIKDTIMFLKGNTRELLNILNERMKTQSENLQFEEAAKTRDLINAVELSSEKQKVYSMTPIDQDIISYHREFNKILFLIILIRNGILQDSKHFIFKDTGMNISILLASFITQYYSQDNYVPEEILIKSDVDDLATIENWLKEIRGKSTSLIVPKKGDKLRLVELATKNAQELLLGAIRKEKNVFELLEKMSAKFHLNKIPRRIECYDISNIQGVYPVGSMVTFIDGEADKKHYRHYKIKTVEGANDYAMIEEVLQRRFKRAIEENVFPDLIIIDGGKGQLNIALDVLKKTPNYTPLTPVETQCIASLQKGIVGNAYMRSAAPHNINIIALAKGKVRGRKKVQERVFIPYRKNPIIFNPGDPMLLLLERIRDEAHRFAITFHRRLRKKGTIQSVLDNIRGIGAKRKKALIEHFGNIERIKNASIEQLQEVKGISKEVATKIYNHFHNISESSE